MSNYERVKLYLSYGFKVKCRKKDGPNLVSIIFSSIVDDFRLRHSIYDTSLEECYKTLGYDSDQVDWINKQDFIYITPIIEKPKMYEVGDLVDIAEEAVDCVSIRQDEKRAMIGFKGAKINSVNDTETGVSYTVTARERIGCWTFPHYYLTPHIPEQDDEVSKAIKTLQDAGVLLDSVIRYFEAGSK